MRKFTVMTALSALVIATASGIVPASASSATECTDFLAPGTYRQVVVPDGAVCLSEGPVRIQAGLWIGSGATNTVSGTVTMRDNTLVDPDGNEYVTNTIHGSLSCWGNSPAPQIGDSEGSPNDVTGRKAGQCTGV